MPASARKKRERTEHIHVHARIPVSLIRRIDRIADENFADRSTALRLVLQRGLTVTPKRNFLEG